MPNSGNIIVDTARARGFRAAGTISTNPSIAATAEGIAIASPNQPAMQPASSVPDNSVRHSPASVIPYLVPSKSSIGTGLMPSKGDSRPAL